MICFRNRSALCGLVLFLRLNGAFNDALAQKSSLEGNATSALDTAEVLKQVDKLVEQNRQLENTNRELMDQIGTLRQALAEKVHSVSGSAQQANSGVDQPTREVVVNTSPQRQVTQQSQGSEADSEAPDAAEPERWCIYTPNRGFRIANTEHGDLNLSIYTHGNGEDCSSSAGTRGHNRSHTAGPGIQPCRF